MTSSETPVKSMLAEDQQKNIFYFFIGENILAEHTIYVINNINILMLKK